MKWIRKEFVTRGADPTVVVEWSNGDTTITEFQNVYITTDKRGRLFEVGAAVFGEKIHKTLEADYWDKMDAQSEAEWDRAYRH